MAEERQGGAQNKLGQLYVELGAKGLSGLTKGLNGLSAQFLLTKNAAQQAIKPLADMSMKAANSVTGWDKLHAVMGLSLQEIQDISRFTKLNNVDFSSFMGQLKGVQKMLFDIKAGMGSEGLQGLAILGLDAYNFDPRKPLTFLDAVKKRVMEVDEVQAAAALRYLGLNEELLYVWKQQNNNFDERLNLSDKEMNNLKELQSAWNSLKVTWEAALLKFIANQKWISGLLQMSIELFNSFGFIIKTPLEQFETFDKILRNIGKTIKEFSKKLINWFIFEKNPILWGADYLHYKFTGKPSEDIARKRELVKRDLTASSEEIHERQAKGDMPFWRDNKISDKMPQYKALKTAVQLQSSFKTGHLNNKDLIENIKNAIPMQSSEQNINVSSFPQGTQEPLKFLPSSLQKELYQNFTINIEQNIRGENPRQIADNSVSGIKDVFEKNIMLSSYNTNLQQL